MIIVDFLLYLFGILFWFSGEFAHSLGVSGIGRFFAGLVAFIIGLIITIILVRGK